MLDHGLVERQRLGELFAGIQPLLYRFPAVNAAVLAERVAAVVKD